MSDQTPIEITHQETKLGVPVGNVNIEDIIGVIPRVTATPTWTPRLFKDGFAISLITGTYKLWVYDYVGNVWKSTTLS